MNNSNKLKAKQIFGIKIIKNAEKSHKFSHRQRFRTFDSTAMQSPQWWVWCRLQQMLMTSFYKLFSPTARSGPVVAKDFWPIELPVDRKKKCFVNHSTTCHELRYQYLHRATTDAACGWERWWKFDFLAASRRTSTPDDFLRLSSPAQCRWTDCTVDPAWFLINRKLMRISRDVQTDFYLFACLPKSRSRDASRPPSTCTPKSCPAHPRSAASAGCCRGSWNSASRRTADSVADRSCHHNLSNHNRLRQAVEECEN